MSDFTCPSEIRCFYPNTIQKYNTKFIYIVGDTNSITLAMNIYLPHMRSLILAFASHVTNNIWSFDLSITGGCTGSSESIHVKTPHCWKSHESKEFYGSSSRFIIRLCI